MFDDLNKNQLVELLTLIKKDVNYIQKCAEKDKAKYEKGKDLMDLARSSGYEQSARWINEQFDKYLDRESTRP